MKIILASKSPRRKELLSSLYKEFQIVVSDADEALPERTPAEDAASLIAMRKGEAVYRRILGEYGEAYADDCLIISSDTIVEIGGELLGKPKDKADAYAMISKLSGKAHNVRTGVSVLYGGKSESATATTKVFFRPLTAAEIEAYVETAEPYDKAGSYGIQGEAGKFVEKIEGDYDTVVGLSLALVSELVRKVTE